MLNTEIFEIKIIECKPSDQLLKDFITFGLEVKKGERTAVIEDITDDRRALDDFAQRLKRTDFDLSVLGELVDDFLAGRYGL